MTNILPENAPFTPQQRAWLEGFFAAYLGAPVSSANHANGANGSPSVNGTPHLNGMNGAANGKPVSESAQADFASLLPVTSIAGSPTKPDKPIAPAKKPTPIYNRDDPFPSRVLHVKELSGESSEKDVRAVALDLAGSGLAYEAGDALGVWAENCPELVEALLETLEATGEEPVITPESRVVPARLALAKAYDITRVGEDFLLLLAEYADDAAAEELRVLAENDPDNWLEGRDVLDVLHRFDFARPPVGDFVAALQPLQPRLYSIASSQKAHPDEVHLTIGVVRYHANDRHRKGVASTYLADHLNEGQKAGIFVHPSPGFRLPADGNTPVIMVGPGTGIAPFRAFLQERRATGATGKNWLFFGDQRRHCDFLYHDELMEFLNDGTLARLDTAFSRDQAEKIYVQTRMLESAADIWHWLEEGAHFYVCGDAKRMAKDVDNALVEIVAQHGGMTPGEAKAYVQNLAKSRRYARDVY